MTYTILVIPAVLLALLVFMVIRQRRVDRAFKESMKAMDEEIAKGSAQLKTVVDFVRNGNQIHAGETVKSVGDGFIVVEDLSGKETVVFPSKESVH